MDTMLYIHTYVRYILDARKRVSRSYCETMVFQRRVSARTCCYGRCYQTFGQCFNCAFNWIDLTSPGQQHRKTRRPWPQPADGQQDVGAIRLTVHTNAGMCPYDLTYEATSRFFRTGREQEQEDTGHLECLDDREFPRGYCRDFSRRNVRIGRLARRSSFPSLFSFLRRFHFRCYIRPERSGRINWYFMRPAKIIPDSRL